MMQNMIQAVDSTGVVIRDADLLVAGESQALVEIIDCYAREPGGQGARGSSKLTLEVHATNEAAMRLYRRFGFGPWDAPTLFVTKPLPGSQP